jgi:hypothetical protein
MWLSVAHYSPAFCHRARLQEVPLPPAGRVEVQYSIGDRVLTFTRPPANNPIASATLPYRTALECLDIENLLTLFSCILLEQQVE